MQMGKAIAADVPVIVFDPLDGTHTPVSEGGQGDSEGHHIICSNVLLTLGYRAQLRLNIVKTESVLFEYLKLMVG